MDATAVIAVCAVVVAVASLGVSVYEAREFNKLNADKLRATLKIRPAANTMGGKPFLAPGYDRFLLSVDSYDSSQHYEIRELIERRLRFEIEYDSLYGGERFVTVYPRSPDSAENPAG